MVAKEVIGARIIKDQVILLDKYCEAFSKNRTDLIEESLNMLFQYYHKEYGTPEDILSKKSLVK